MGFHSYQRYLFSRPLPIEECEKFIDEFANRQYGDGWKRAVLSDVSFEIQ